MKPFNRIKKINGIEYIYEVTPYYDKESKRVKQHSKYLGKNDNGNPVKVRERLPVASLSYGEILPFAKVSQEIGINNILNDYLKPEEVECINAIAFNRVTNPMAMQHIETWYENTYLHNDKSISFTSQWISRLLTKIGQSSLPSLFSNELLKQFKTKSVLLYDITSLSSYSKTIELLEYGYNRDGDSLPQANLSITMDKDTGIPVMYDIYPGSIVDVSTLANTLAKLKSHGVKDGMFVLDRGFFSTENIKSLEGSGLNYIIPASEILKEVKKVISGIHKQIVDPNNMKIHNGSPLFTKNVTIKIGKHDVSGYCYYSPKQAHEEEEWLYKKLHAIKTAIEGLSGITGAEAKQKVESIAGKYFRYITVKFIDGKAVVTIRKQVVAQRIKEMGKFILLYKKDSLDWKECLDTYRSRDLIEKGFDILKNDLELATPGVHKADTLRGLMFVCYLGLLLKMRVLKQLEKSSLHTKYTLPEIMVELSKLKTILMSNGEKIKTELSKKQKEILAALNLCA